MPLLAYNKTTAPLALAAGNPIVTLPASSSVNVRGKAYNVTGELQPNLTVDPNNGVATGGLSAANFTALQVQVAANQVEYEWTTDPEYLVATLVVGSAPVDIADDDVFIYYDDMTGNDGNAGTLAAPVKTFLKAWSLLPSIFKKKCQLIQVGAGTYPIPGNPNLTPPMPSAGNPECFTMIGVSEVQTDTVATHIVSAASATGIVLTVAGADFVAGKYGNGIGGLGGTVKMLTGAAAGDRRMIRSNGVSTIVPNEPFHGISIGDTFQVELPTAILNPAALTSFEGPCSMAWLDIKWRLGGATSRLGLLNGCNVLAAEGVEIDCNTGSVNMFNRACIQAGLGSFPASSPPVPPGDTNLNPTYFLAPFSILAMPCGVFIHDGNNINVLANSSILGSWMGRAVNFNGEQGALMQFQNLVTKNCDIHGDDACILWITGNGNLPGICDGKGTFAATDGIIAIGRTSIARLDRVDVSNSTTYGITTFKGGDAEIRRVGGTGNTLGGVGLATVGGVGAAYVRRSQQATITGAGGDIIVGATPVTWAALFAIGITGFTEPLVVTDAVGSSGQRLVRVDVGA